MTLMKAAATLRNTEGGGVRLRLGGPKHSQDKANDTASSTFNTCLASTTLERWNTTHEKRQRGRLYNQELRLGD